jgi:NTP pyrophosphatase (non-canonical NTP hydrolase)
MGLYDGKSKEEICYDLFKQIRPPIRKFAHQMEQKFQIHKERGDPFQRSSKAFLYKRLFEELAEFFEAIESRKSTGDVLKEGADVANIILMIVVNYRNTLLIPGGFR